MSMYQDLGYDDEREKLSNRSSFDTEVNLPQDIMYVRPTDRVGGPSLVLVPSVDMNTWSPRVVKQFTGTETPLCVDAKHQYFASSLLYMNYSLVFPQNRGNKAQYSTSFVSRVGQQTGIDLLCSAGTQVVEEVPEFRAMRYIRPRGEKGDGKGPALSHPAPTFFQLGVVTENYASEKDNKALSERPGGVAPCLARLRKPAGQSLVAAVCATKDGFVDNATSVGMLSDPAYQAARFVVPTMIDANQQLRTYAFHTEKMQNNVSAYKMVWGKSVVYTQELQDALVRIRSLQVSDLFNFLTPEEELKLLLERAVEVYWRTFLVMCIRKTQYHALVAREPENQVLLQSMYAAPQQVQAVVHTPIASNSAFNQPVQAVAPLQMPAGYVQPQQNTAAPGYPAVPPQQVQQHQPLTMAPVTAPAPVTPVPQPQAAAPVQPQYSQQPSTVPVTAPTALGIPTTPPPADMSGLQVAPNMGMPQTQPALATNVAGPALSVAGNDAQAAALIQQLQALSAANAPKQG